MPLTDSRTDSSPHHTEGSALPRESGLSTIVIRTVLSYSDAGLIREIASRRGLRGRRCNDARMHTHGQSITGSTLSTKIGGEFSVTQLSTLACKSFSYQP